MLPMLILMLMLVSERYISSLYQEYATIVDTPGVGESEDMTNILMDYLSEAVAFIYVINTTNAGGIQDDRV